MGQTLKRKKNRPESKANTEEGVKEPRHGRSPGKAGARHKFNLCLQEQEEAVQEEEEVDEEEEASPAPLSL